MDLKKSISLKNRLKEVLKDCLLSSTGHGLAHFIKANNCFMRITWTFFTIISACFCSYMIAQNILKYLKFDVNTKIRVVNQFSAVFPTVTICNMNFFSSDFSLNFTTQFINDTKNNNPFSNSGESILINVAKMPEFHTNLNLYGDLKEKLIADCSFEMIPCNRSKLKYYLHPNYGNCFQFNPGYDNYENSEDLEST
ncbi:acid-sensing ion channel 5 [Brachionus plicatilis]|uniref:Acid-sensing ion channel 5 n=1 Tax=Brachionus plicatilis TaxID=10195 RepID=A0A3M7QW40_BRAPC|nr:acid-sensing ion channel 5 [Brachionus plicatilis]